MRLEAEQVPEHPPSQHHLVGPRQRAVLAEQVVELRHIAARERQCIARDVEQIPEVLRTQRIAAKGPADHAFERERHFALALFVARDHALADMESELVELPRELRLRASLATHVPQSIADPVSDGAPAGDLEFVSFWHALMVSPLAMRIDAGRALQVGDTRP